MKCQLCGGSDFDVVSKVDAKSRKPLEVSICTNCGLVQQTPMPSAEDLRMFYGENYRKEYKGVVAPKAKHVYRAGNAALNRISFLQSNAGGPWQSILDLGAGAGEFVYMCGKLGVGVARGIEPNVGYCEHAQLELGVEIKNVDLGKVTGKYNLITMFHVFEHLINPLEVFEKIHGLLEEDGILFVEVPWIESPTQSPSKFFFKAHTLYFAISTLKSCASRYFVTEVVDTKTGHLRMLFRKRPVPAALELPDAATVETLRKRVQSNGWLIYLFEGGGIFRPVQKVFQIFKERRVLGMAGRRILDDLIAGRAEA
jgi:2-polyprenyl-3-methyl-5-hydroxy-6-metoxy-1,4-benzoquinol methylase